MHDEQNDHTSAAAELRRRLSDGLAQARLSKTQLARRIGLSRTTVQLAFQADGPVPSLETVAALADALKLPMGELLELQRTANGESRTDDSGAPGRPIGQWEPHELEVHPAGPGTASSPGRAAARVLPGYVLRQHDQVLAEAVRDVTEGRSRIVVLVGTSSTGKTRACWEAVQPLAEKGWRLWHPFDPTRAEAALDELCRVEPRTVVWLNEAQHYLGDQAVGERIAAAVHQLLIDKERGPVLVLGTLWPEYARQYTALPEQGGSDLHSRVRELLAGHTLAVPEAFNADALATAAALAEGGDRLVADALTRARDSGRIAQDLAGAPELLRRYEQAAAPARALLEAAMDARRLGVGLHLPHAFLTDAALDYLSDVEFDQLTDDWVERAFAELAELVHGKQAPLRRANPRTPRRPPTPTTAAPLSVPPAAGPVFRLADYLEQHGRTTRAHQCPPASFWHSAHTHLTDPDDFRALALAAEHRHRLQWAHHLRLRVSYYQPDEPFHLARMREAAGDRENAEVLYWQAVERGDTQAMGRLAEMREEAGDQEGAEALALQAADRGDTNALVRLAVMRDMTRGRASAEVLYQEAVDRGDPQAMRRLAVMREEVGDRSSAEVLALQAADLGDTNALISLAVMRAKDRDRESAEVLARQAADRGDIRALGRLAAIRREAGDRESAEVLNQEAADRGDPQAMGYLAVMREEAGEQRSAEVLARQAADRGVTRAMTRLALMRERAGDQGGAELLALKAADRGEMDALGSLAVMRENAGDRKSAELLARQAADRGDTSVLVRLGGIRVRAGDRESAEVLYQQIVDRGDTQAMRRLAVMREEAGDRKSAELLALQAADRGDTSALVRLGGMRERAGDREGAELVALQAADRGDCQVLLRLAAMRGVAGDRRSAELLYRQAADLGSTSALLRLAMMREEAGDRKSAELLYRQFADYGDPQAMRRLGEGREKFLRLWPYGLDPDGTPTRRWQGSGTL